MSFRLTFWNEIALLNGSVRQPQLLSDLAHVGGETYPLICGRSGQVPPASGGGYAV